MRFEVDFRFGTTTELLWFRTVDTATYNSIHDTWVLVSSLSLVGHSRLFSQTVPVLKRPPDQFAVSQLLDRNVVVYAPAQPGAWAANKSADWLITWLLKQPPDQFAVSQLLDGNVCVYARLGRARMRLTLTRALIGWLPAPYSLYTGH